MTQADRQVVEDFCLRQFNRVVLDALLGDDLFERIREDRLSARDRDYLLYLAEQEAQELAGYYDRATGRPVHPKIERLAANNRAATTVLLAAQRSTG